MSTIFFKPAELEAAAQYIEKTLAELGYAVATQRFPSGQSEVRNVEVEVNGSERAPVVARVAARSAHVLPPPAGFPSEGVAEPTFIPDVDWSGHWSFWQEGWPALMVTDTAPYPPTLITTRKLRPCHIGIRRFVIEVEPDTRHGSGYSQCDCERLITSHRSTERHP